MSNEERLKAMTTEIGGGQATHRNILDGVVELRNIRTSPSSKPTLEGYDDFGPPVTKTTTTTTTTERERRNDDDVDVGSPSPSWRSSEASSTDRTSQVPPTRIRSMLEV